MKRIINTSIPLVVTTLRKPLTISLTIANSGADGGPLTQAQDTQKNPQVWIPNRQQYPLFLAPNFVAKNTENGETITNGYTIQWYVEQGSTSTLVTSTNPGDDYYKECKGANNTGDETGRLVVRKNVDYRSPVTIKCVVSYTDNVENRLYHAEDSVSLTTTNLPDEIYTVAIQAPYVINYDPIYAKKSTTLANGAFQYGSKFRFSAKTQLGKNDATAGVYYFWYIGGTLITTGAGSTAIQYKAADQLPGKGLGTDTIILDADYGDSFTVTVKVGTFEEVANPTGNPKTKGYYEESGGVYSKTNDTTVNALKTYYTAPSEPNQAAEDSRDLVWSWPDIDSMPVSLGGNAVRSNAGNKEFTAVVQADGVDVDDAITKEYVRLNWKRHAMNGNTVVDMGWGKDVSVKNSDLNKTGGENVEVYADVYLLSANGRLVDDSSGIAPDFNGYITDDSGSATQSDCNGFVVGRT